MWTEVLSSFIYQNKCFMSLQCRKVGRAHCCVKKLIAKEMSGFVDVIKYNNNPTAAKYVYCSRNIFASSQAQ